MSQQNLQKNVYQILEPIGVSDDKNDIADSHRLGDNEQKIVEFLRRKDCKQIF